MPHAVIPSDYALVLCAYDRPSLPLSLPANDSINLVLISLGYRPLSVYP
jgi:hypothetical protein